MADIASDGPFSAFPGVDRWFAVVTGSGVLLTLDGQERTLKAGDAPFHFEGAAAPGCRLVDGTTRDLNLMLKGGRGAMRPVTPGAPWGEDFAMRGLFTAVPGRCSGGVASHALEEHTLLWEDEARAGAWRFSPDEQGAAPAGWWLGFAP
jgi:environmental stress-induced protein Ves